MNKDDLLNALYLEFVNRTNEVGVDINRAIQFSHTANLVQFVCGLGPRKGTFYVKVSTILSLSVYVCICVLYIRKKPLKNSIV